MWCARCQADVAAEVSSDAQHVRCAHCGAEIINPLASRTASRTRQARELLKRWAQRDHEEANAGPHTPMSTTDVAVTAGADNNAALRDSEEHQATLAIHNPEPEQGAENPAGTGSHADSPAAASPHRSAADTPATKATEPSSSLWRHLDGPAGQSVRIDEAHHAARSPLSGPVPSANGSGTAAASEAATTSGVASASNSDVAANSTSFPERDKQSTPRTEPKGQPETRRIDAGHRNVPAPHAAWPQKQTPQKSERNATNWVSTAGQWLAYLGVLGLMAGTCLVLLGYFRGPASYAPTGWLITMAGQMLLFLGVVTLVSAGMEQTAHTVAKHIDRLEETLRNIERPTQSKPTQDGGLREDR